MSTSGKGTAVMRRSSRLAIGILLALVCILASGTATAYAVEVPGAPAWLTPPGGYTASYATITLVPGSSTSSMTLFLNGASLGTRECTTGVAVSFGRAAMPAGISTLVAVASNGALTSSWEYRVRRIEHPWATCIIIDKSDYRLYWIRNGELVKSYRIAVGKRSTQTPNAVWKVGRKERTPPRGVYGPRKLRLFRRVVYHTRAGRHAYRYKYTNYGIHGTNQPWVIGTMASHGCIRLTNTQILDLWPQVPLGTLVQTRP